MRKVIPLTIFFAGAVLVGNVLLPISISHFSYIFNPKSHFLDPTAVSSLPMPAVAGASTSIDYTQPSAWFDTSSLPPAPKIVSKVGFYTISVPRLNINAAIEINGTDLKNNPIQYPGTAIPGTYGNTVIFGHSTLPQLYKPADPLSIFVPLIKIKKGDEVIINYDGVTYRYIVRDTTEVEPTEIAVLAQRYDKHELTLITCVPLGTYARRFVARAELVN